MLDIDIVSLAVRLAVRRRHNDNHFRLLYFIIDCREGPRIMSEHKTRSSLIRITRDPCFGIIAQGALPSWI